MHFWMVMLLISAITVFLTCCSIVEYACNENNEPTDRVDGKEFWSLVLLSLCWPVVLLIALCVASETQAHFWSNLGTLVSALLNKFVAPFAWLVHILGTPGRLLERKRVAKRLFASVKQRKIPHKSKDILHRRGKCLLCDCFPAKQFELELISVAKVNETRISGDLPVKPTLFNKWLLRVTK